MNYLGDFRLGKTFSFKFTTTAAATGAPTTLAGTPSVAVYVGNSTVEITAGITLTVDFDGRTGLNDVTIVATSGNGYSASTNCAVVITAGTVGGTSAVGYVVGSFSIEARSALMPTTVDRTLVVDAAGLADANAVKLGPTGAGTALTARDIGASVDALVLPAGHVGDLRLGKTFSVKFRTATTLSGSPVVSAYKANSTVELTAGITLTVDFDARTGLNDVTIVATSGNGYETAMNYSLVITTGTVGGVSAVGQHVGSFSIEARSALMPTTVDRTLVVDASGLADANTVKVGPTGAGTVQTAGDIMADTNDIQTRLPAALVGGRMDSSVGAMAANVVTAAAIAVDAIGASELAADAVTEIQSGLATSAALVTAQADLDDIQTRLPAALVGGRMDANSSAIAGDATAATDLKSGALGLVPSTCAAGSTTTSIVTNLTEATDSHYNGRVITFTSGALLGQTSDITAYNGTTKTLTVTALTEAPVNTDAFVIS